MGLTPKPLPAVRPADGPWLPSQKEPYAASPDACPWGRE